MAISFRSSDHDHGDVISWDHIKQATPVKRATPVANAEQGSRAAAKKLVPKKLTPKKLAPWETLLVSMIKSEVLPRLISAQKAGLDKTAEGGLPDLNIRGFVELIIADDLEQIRAVADQVIVQCGGRDAMLHQLLTPAARYLGEMWERDACDFMTVTLGVYRLDQIMKETATPELDDVLMSGHERSILLLPAPGEQHSFGLGMVADAFRGHGWCVRSGPAVTRAKLLRLVRDEWFDVVGLSASSDRALQGLSSYLRAIRMASCNPRVYIMLGGNAVQRNAESARFLGANATAADAVEAVAKVKLLFENSMTATLNQSIKR